MVIASQAQRWEGVETRRAASHADEGIVQTTNSGTLAVKTVVGMKGTSARRDRHVPGIQVYNQ